MNTKKCPLRLFGYLNYCHYNSARPKGSDSPSLIFCCEWQLCVCSKLLSLQQRQANFSVDYSRGLSDSPSLIFCCKWQLCVCSACLMKHRILHCIHLYHIDTSNTTLIQMLNSYWEKRPIYRSSLTKCRQNPPCNLMLTSCYPLQRRSLLIRYLASHLWFFYSHQL